MILLLLLVSCSPTDLGEAQTLTPSTLDAHLGSRVTLTGTPTPTRTIEYTTNEKTCLLFYFIGNRKLFVEDCTNTEPLSTYTGRLHLLSTLPNSRSIAAYYRDRFDLKVIPRTTYVLVPDS
jgi:hypothetical protein